MTWYPYEAGFLSFLAESLNTLMILAGLWGGVHWYMSRPGIRSWFLGTLTALVLFCLQGDEMWTWTVLVGAVILIGHSLTRTVGRILWAQCSTCKLYFETVSEVESHDCQPEDAHG